MKIYSEFSVIYCVCLSNCIVIKRTSICGSIVYFMLHMERSNHSSLALYNSRTSTPPVACWTGDGQDCGTVLLKYVVDIEVTEVVVTDCVYDPLTDRHIRRITGVNPYTLRVTTRPTPPFLLYQTRNKIISFPKNAFKLNICQKSEMPPPSPLGSLRC